MIKRGRARENGRKIVRTLQLLFNISVKMGVLPELVDPRVFFSVSGNVTNARLAPEGSQIAILTVKLQLKPHGHNSAEKEGTCSMPPLSSYISNHIACPIFPTQQ